MPLSSGIRSKFRAALRRLRQDNAELPASIDECMAYFTGYKPTSKDLPYLPSNAGEFIELARKSVRYCDYMHDKQTLQLLFYSVIKRIPRQYIGDVPKICALWDAVAGDEAGLYKGNTELQVQDMSRVFYALLKCLEVNKVGINIDPLKPWEDSNAPNIGNKKNPKLHSEGGKDYDFHRGGGLYHFIDILKKVSPGTKDDNSDLKGIYVTPKTPQESDDAADRTDRLYGNDPNRCRSFGDIPTHQFGSIPGEYLYKVNDNTYEAFIPVEALQAMKAAPNFKLKLKEMASPVNKPQFIVSKHELAAVSRYAPADPAKKGFEQRLTMIHDVLNADGHAQKDLQLALEKFFTAGGEDTEKITTPSIKK